jgi:DNA-binding response OmpR family regulator
MEPIKVLCVESDLEYMDALRSMMEGAGYQVMAAATGSQAIALLSGHQVHGVLLEYDLPDANGNTVRMEMKRMKPDVPVLLFSRIGSQTPFLLRFFDAYLRNADKPEAVFEELDP